MAIAGAVGALKKSHRLRWLCWLSLVSALHAEPVPDGLADVNQALRSWLRLMEEDRPYLLFDQGEGQIDLRHGGAVLRTCQVVVDSSEAVTPHRGELLGHLRRYRPAHPWATASPGPFDWEQVLATEASNDSALLFSNQLLIYASDAWDSPRGPAVRLGEGDLRTLYNALEKGTPLVILPPGWIRFDDEP